MSVNVMCLLTYKQVRLSLKWYIIMHSYKEVIVTFLHLLKICKRSRFTVYDVTGQQIAPWMTLDVAALIILTTSLTSQIRIIKIKIIPMIVSTTQQIRW
jgi:hypothetical protein